jgi:hypothetical protein
MYLGISGFGVWARVGSTSQILRCLPRFHGLEQNVEAYAIFLSKFLLDGNERFEELQSTYVLTGIYQISNLT